MLDTDKTLLELAVKGAGYKFKYWKGSLDYSREGFYLFDASNTPCSNDHYWNPLYDWGDALILAVDCDIDIQFNRAPDEQTVTAICPDPECYYSGMTFTESFGISKISATCRAIVRAAACLGELK